MTALHSEMCSVPFIKKAWQIDDQLLGEEWKLLCLMMLFGGGVTDNNWGEILLLLWPEAVITLKLNTLMCCFKTSLVVRSEAICRGALDGRECTLQNLMGFKIILHKTETNVHCITELCI